MRRVIRAHIRARALVIGVLIAACGVSACTSDPAPPTPKGTAVVNSPGSPSRPAPTTPAPSVSGSGTSGASSTDGLWLFQHRIDGYATSGTQRAYAGAGGVNPNSTTFWVGCDGLPSVTRFVVPRGVRRLAGLLTLDPAVTPAGVTAAAQITGGTGAPVSIDLQAGVERTLEVSVQAGATLTLSVLKSAGTCSPSAIGYGVAIGARFE